MSWPSEDNGRGKKKNNKKKKQQQQQQKKKTNNNDSKESNRMVAKSMGFGRTDHTQNSEIGGGESQSPTVNTPLFD
jgi:hypothetical protein